MWHVWIAVFCCQVASGATSSPEPGTALDLISPAVQLTQQDPQAEAGQKGQQQETQEEEGALPRLQPRIAGPRQEQKEEITPPTGPMRIELYSISESRTRYIGEPPERPQGNSIRLLVNLTGERLPEIVGMGHLVIEEMTDDTGAVLAAPDELQRRDQSATSPVRITDRMVQRGYVQRVGDARGPTREARRIKKTTGWINLVYATETEDILVDNPLQYLGGYIEHPRLQELGLKIKVVEPGEEVRQIQERGGIALQFERSAKQVQHVGFFDAWLKPMYPRSRRVEAPDGQEYVYYSMVVGNLDADVQMILTVYPEIEEERVRFEFEDIKLP
jgi:hypothetical protein